MFWCWDSSRCFNMTSEGLVHRSHLFCTLQFTFIVQVDMRDPCSNMYAVSLWASFFQIKLSSFDHTNAWSSDQWGRGHSNKWSRMLFWIWASPLWPVGAGALKQIDLECYFEYGPPPFFPPHITHVMNACLPCFLLLCIMSKKWGSPGNQAKVISYQYISSILSFAKSTLLVSLTTAVIFNQPTQLPQCCSSGAKCLEHLFVILYLKLILKVLVACIYSSNSIPDIPQKRDIKAPVPAYFQRVLFSWGANKYM